MQLAPLHMRRVVAPQVLLFEINTNRNKLQATATSTTTRCTYNSDKFRSNVNAAKRNRSCNHKMTFDSYSVLYWYSSIFVFLYIASHLNTCFGFSHSVSMNAALLTNEAVISNLVKGGGGGVGWG